jgi:hypothetical protein
MPAGCHVLLRCLEIQLSDLKCCTVCTGGLAQWPAHSKGAKSGWPAQGMDVGVCSCALVTANPSPGSSHAVAGKIKIRSILGASGLRIRRDRPALYLIFLLLSVEVELLLHGSKDARHALSSSFRRTHPINTAPVVACCAPFPAGRSCPICNKTPFHPTCGSIHSFSTRSSGKIPAKPTQHFLPLVHEP